MAAFGLDFDDLVPSDDWELNILLLKIGNELSDEEFSKLKFLCSGRKGVPAGSLDRLKTPEKLFVYLRERGMISRDNLLLLQAFLWHLDRQDLHEKASDYARTVGNTLYFYAPDRGPADGYQHVKFLIEGNLDRYHRKDLEALRSTMSRLLFVPQEYIFLRGVEPSDSLTLTFMIHEQCISPLRALLREDKDSLGQLGVNGVLVDGKEYLFQPSQIVRRLSAPAGSVTNAEMHDLFQRNVKLERITAENEVLLLEAQDVASKATQLAQEMRRRESYFRALVVRTTETDRESLSNIIRSNPSLV